MSLGIISLQIKPSIFYPIKISKHRLKPNRNYLFFTSKPAPPITAANSPQQQQPKPHQTTKTTAQDDGIPVDDVKILAQFKSRHNYIRVLEVSRRTDHPFAGSRLLLLDGPGNIHSICFLFKSLTDTYLDVFATLPPIIPPGPIAILGFGAGSAARLILETYPDAVIHGWELDPAVISVGREYFNLAKLEKQYSDRLFIYIGNALKASVRDGFSGILVDLFSRGSLVPQLEDPNTWEKLRKSLRRDGRIMVNVGGSCVEAENKRRDGKVVMEATLKAMNRVFGDQFFVLNFGNKKDDSSVALTGPLPVLDAWKKTMPRPLRCYVDMWKPYDGNDQTAQAVLESKDAPRKTFSGNSNFFPHDESWEITNKKIMPSRSLRLIVSVSPPAPIRAKPNAQRSYAPPPQIV